jgi:hypothetical protein
LDSGQLPGLVLARLVDGNIATYTRNAQRAVTRAAQFIQALAPAPAVPSAAYALHGVVGSVWLGFACDQHADDLIATRPLLPRDRDALNRRRDKRRTELAGHRRASEQEGLSLVGRRGREARRAGEGVGGATWQLERLLRPLGVVSVAHVLLLLGDTAAVPVPRPLFAHPEGLADLRPAGSGLAGIADDIPAPGSE